MRRVIQVGDMGAMARVRDACDRLVARLAPLTCIRRPARTDLLGLIVLAPALALWLFAAITVAGETGRFVDVDFATYFKAAVAIRLDRHSDIYDPSVLRSAAIHADMRGCPPTDLAYLYPPTLAEALVPFSRLPCGEVAHAWRLLGIALWGAVTTLLTVDLMRAWPHGLRILAAAAVVMLSLLCFPMQEGLGLGQVTCLVLALLSPVPALERRGRSGIIVAGVLLAAATAVKVLPALLLLYWALHRRWGVLIGTLSVGGALLSLSLLISGPQALTAMRETRLSIVGPEFNLSLWVQPWAGWPMAAVVGSATLAAIAWARERGERRLGYGWMLAALLLCSPLTWWNYTAWLLPALVWCAACVPPTRWGHVMPLTALVVASASLYAPAAGLYPAFGLLLLWLLIGVQFLRPAIHPHRPDGTAKQDALATFAQPVPAGAPCATILDGGQGKGVPA